MRCPKCEEATTVYWSRVPAKQPQSVARRRRCPHCRATFRTTETPDADPEALRVVMAAINRWPPVAAALAAEKRRGR